MSKTKKVHIINSSTSYNTMFKQMGWDIVTRKEEADLIQFTGGADVSPELYGELKHPNTANDLIRDCREIHIYEWAKKRNLPVAGICRGGQFLHVMNDGKLYQHVYGHSESHNAIAILDKKEITVSSTHHQMMREHPDAELVLESIGVVEEFQLMNNDLIEAVYPNGTSIKEIEAVIWPNTNTLCYQPHPEFAVRPAIRSPKQRKYGFYETATTTATKITNLKIKQIKSPYLDCLNYYFKLLNKIL